MKEDIETIESAAKELAGTAPAVLTVGRLRFVADEEASCGDLWFRNPEIEIVFARSTKGGNLPWYCASGNISAYGRSPEEAFGSVLHRIAVVLRDMTAGGVSLQMDPN